MDVYHAYDDYETEVVPQRLLIVDQWLCKIKGADRLPEKVAPEKVRRLTSSFFFLQQQSFLYVHDTTAY